MMVFYVPGGHRPRTRRVHATGQQGDRERAVRTLPHKDLQEDGLSHRQLSQSGNTLILLVFVGT